MKKLKPFEKFYRLEKIIDFQLYLLFVIGILLIVITIIDKQGEQQFMWTDILINFASGIVGSIAVSIFIYFKFLKHIPEETEKKINDLLNSRLSYETANHNAVMRSLNPDNEHLSREHTELKQEIKSELTGQVLPVKATVDNIKGIIQQEQWDKQLKYSNLQVSQKEIADSIDKISNLNEQMQAINQKNVELKEQLNQVKESLQEKTNEYFHLSKSYETLKNDYYELKNELSSSRRNGPTKSHRDGYDHER